MKDYSEYRLLDEAELYPYMVEMGQKEYRTYFNNLYKKVMSLKPGQSFNVDDLVVEKNRIMFIKMLCLIIQLLPAGRYLFNETFTVFSHRPNVELPDNTTTRERRQGNVRR